MTFEPESLSCGDELVVSPLTDGPFAQANFVRVSQLDEHSRAR